MTDRKVKITTYRTDILLLDIVGYSTLSNEEQFATVFMITNKLRDLLGILSRLSFLKESELTLGFIPTGDGFYIILQPEFAGYGIFLAISLRSSLLTHSHKAGDLYKGVRIAIHLGDAIPFDDITGKVNFVGDGLNDCARLLLAKTHQSPMPGLPEDDNYIVASEAAIQWFDNYYSPTSSMGTFLKTIKYKRSGLFVFQDKHQKEHRAEFIESNRNIAIKPPHPKDLQDRMKKLKERLEQELSPQKL